MYSIFSHFFRQESQSYSYILYKISKYHGDYALLVNTIYVENAIYVGGSSLCPTVHLPRVSAEFLSSSSIFPSPEFVCTGEFLRPNLNGCVDLLGQHGIRLLSKPSRYISFSTNEEEARGSMRSGSIPRDT